MRFRLQTSLGHVIAAEFLGLPVIARDGITAQIFGSVMAFREIENLGYDAITNIDLYGARVIWTEPIPGQGPAISLLSGIHGKPFSTFQVIDGGLSGR